MKGFLCTSNNREKESVREAYNILNEVADKLYGPENKSSESEDKVGGEIEDELEQEISKLKNPPEKAERRFQVVSTGVKSCVFIRTTVNNPLEVMNNITSHIRETGEQKTRHLLRMLPVVSTCKVNADEIIKAAESVIKEYLPNYATFSILYKVRNNKLNREDVIPRLADLIKTTFPSIKVDLDNAEVCVAIEIVQKVCCISVVPNYFGNAKYNLIELAQKKK
nr:EOG090X0GPG [Cyclestheria hislopi]